MSGAEFGSFMLPLVLLLAAAHLLGHLFVRIRQPRVVGEILAGVLLSPAVFGRLSSGAAQTIFPLDTASGIGIKYQAVMGFLYNLGLALLMFASGAESRGGLFQRQDRKELAWLGGFGTGLPFLVALAAAPFLPLERLMGPANNRTSLLLIVGIAVAVTSIPVISRIFHDLKIAHTRFAHLVLSVAIIEDIILWGFLAVATALAFSNVVTEIVVHVVAALLYFVCGLTLFPYLVRRITNASWNVLAKTSPVAYIIIVLLAYAAVAAALNVNLVFAAFLAGYALVLNTELRDAAAVLSKVSFAFFIPLYFAVVGFQLDLTRSFSLSMLVVFAGGACLVKLASAGLGARLAGFSWFDSMNLSIALNARGGPGIVLASVAYDAGIINASFYTTLVLVAILTSQAAGAWLDYVLRRGWALLGAQAVTSAEDAMLKENVAP